MTLSGGSIIAPLSIQAALAPQMQAEVAALDKFGQRQFLGDPARRGGTCQQVPKGVCVRG